MPSQPVLREVKRISVCSLVLTAIMLIVFALCKHFDVPALLGGLLGCAFNIVNFTIMSISVERSVSKSGAAAKSAMGLSYFARLALAAVVIYWAIKAPYFNYIAAIIPLVFTRLSVYILWFIDNRKGVDKA